MCRAIYAIAFKMVVLRSKKNSGRQISLKIAGYIIFFKVKQQASYDRISENDEQDEDDLREHHEDLQDREAFHEDSEERFGVCEDFRLNGQGFIDEGEIKRIQEFLRNKVKMPKATGQDLNRKNSSTTSGELQLPVSLPVTMAYFRSFDTDRRIIIRYESKTGRS